MLTMYKLKQIRSLHKQGKNQTDIARQLNLNRKTVAKYLASNSPPQYPERKKRTKDDKFLPFQSQVEAWIELARDITGIEIFDLLIEAGFRGSQRTVFRRLQTMRASKSKERFFEQEYEPGEQAQFDFKEKVWIPFTHGKEIIHLHFATLPFSDIYFISGWRFRSFEAVAEGLHRFFEKVGGVTESLRIDNLKPCVAQVLIGNRRKYTSAYSRLMEYYDFKTLPCAPGKGSDKGDVEREIRSQAGRIQNLIKVKGLVFSDIEELNLFLAAYCAERWTDQAKEKLILEQAKLSPLACRDEAVLCRVFVSRASAWGTVRDGITKTLYSVPDSFIKANCQVSVGPEKVRITNPLIPSVIVEHTRQLEGGKSILLEHVLPSLVRKPGAMLRWAHREILFPDPEFKKFLTWLGGEGDATARSEFLKCVNLVQYTSLEEISIGMRLVRENSHSHPFDELKALLLVGHRPSQIPAQIRLKPDLTIYDYLIPKPKEGTHESSGASGRPKNSQAI